MPIIFDADHGKAANIFGPKCALKGTMHFWCRSWSPTVDMTPISEIQHKYLHNFGTTQHLQSYVQLLWQVCKVGITWGKWGGWSRWGWGWGWGVKRMQIAEFGRWRWGRCWLFNNQLPTIRCWLFNSILILTSSHQILTFVQSDLLIHSIWETLWGESFVWHGRWKYKIYTRYRNSKYLMQW